MFHRVLIPEGLDDDGNDRVLRRSGCDSRLTGEGALQADPEVWCDGGKLDHCLVAYRQRARKSDPEFVEGEKLNTNRRGRAFEVLVTGDEDDPRESFASRLHGQDCPLEEMPQYVEVRARVVLVVVQQQRIIVVDRARLRAEAEGTVSGYVEVSRKPRSMQRRGSGQDVAIAWTTVGLEGDTAEDPDEGIGRSRRDDGIFTTRRSASEVPSHRLTCGQRQGKRLAGRAGDVKAARRDGLFACVAQGDRRVSSALAVESDVRVDEQGRGLVRGHGRGRMRARNRRQN